MSHMLAHIMWKHKITKLEVQSILHYHQRRTDHSHSKHLAKIFLKYRMVLRYGNAQTERHTYRYADCNTSHHYGGEVTSSTSVIGSIVKKTINILTQLNSSTSIPTDRQQRWAQLIKSSDVINPACKNWVLRCGCGYMTGAKCRLFIYGPAAATASKNPVSSCLI